MGGQVFDHIVIGAGGMGSAAIYELARRGRRVLGLEQFTIPHELGSSAGATRIFRFPPWTRAQIISLETNREVAEGETGLIRVLDLANVFSVMAIQTEDLGVRRGDGFELLGRAQPAEPRGCSLLAT